MTTRKDKDEKYNVLPRQSYKLRIEKGMKNIIYCLLNGHLLIYNKTGKSGQSGYLKNLWWCWSRLKSKMTA